MGCGIADAHQSRWAMMMMMARSIEECGVTRAGQAMEQRVSKHAHRCTRSPSPLQRTHTSTSTNLHVVLLDPGEDAATAGAGEAAIRVGSCWAWRGSSR